MLQKIAPDIWHMQHHFAVNGMLLSSRMTVVRLQGGRLWIHSPVPVSAAVYAQLADLGTVEYLIAPNKMHHLFMSDWVAAFPQAKLFGAPGLCSKRHDLKTMVELQPSDNPEWQSDLDQIFFEGIPMGNETVWFHKPSKTLIITDLCQWWENDLPLASKIYAKLTGVRAQLAVPRNVQWMVKDRPAARASARRILQWPFERVVIAHNAILESGAHAAVQEAFACFMR